MRIKHVLMMVGLTLVMVVLGVGLRQPDQVAGASEFNCGKIDGCAGANVCSAKYAVENGWGYTCYEDKDGNDVLEPWGSVSCPRKESRLAWGGGGIGGHWGCFTPSWYCGSNGECI